MYLLGGALANLALTCILETRGNKAPIEFVFTESGQKLTVSISESGSGIIAEKTLATFERWHQQPSIELDPNTAMLILAEKVVHVASRDNSPWGRLRLPDALVEISLPAHQPSAR